MLNDLNQNEEDIGQSSAFPVHVLDFGCAASFRNQSLSKATAVENRRQISDFFAHLKIRQGERNKRGDRTNLSY